MIMNRGYQILKNDDLLMCKSSDSDLKDRQSAVYKERQADDQI